MSLLGALIMGVLIYLVISKLDKLTKENSYDSVSYKTILANRKARNTTSGKG